MCTEYPLQKCLHVIKTSPVVDTLALLLVLDHTLLDILDAALGLGGSIAHLLICCLCHSAALLLGLLSTQGMNRVKRGKKFKRIG